MNKAIEAKEHDFREEYTTLLNYISLYVNMQKPYVDKIKINVENENYVLRDCTNRVIFKISINEDLLLDILIATAPKQIEIYNAEKIKNIELLKTIVSIFKEKAQIYSG